MPTPSSSALGDIVSWFSLACRICVSRVFSLSLRSTRLPPPIQPPGFEPDHVDRKPSEVRAVGANLYFSAAQEVLYQLVKGGGVLDHGPVPGLAKDVHLHVGQPL